jgi:hypothetical protein
MVMMMMMVCGQKVSACFCFDVGCFVITDK